MIVLLTGGSGCGKSTYAEKLISALPDERRVYVATMQVFDEESRRRVARHRAQRAHMGFQTVETHKALGEAPIPDGAVVLLEDIPNLLAGEMFDGGDWRRIVPDVKALARRCAHLVMVTNDVFSDGVVYDEDTRAWQRHLSEIHRALTDICDYAAEIVYSIPVTLKGEAPCKF